jgi:hypothetical protein
MSFFVTPFEVSARTFPEPVKCRFVHIFPGIATRHSDTIDCVFRMNGRPVMVAIPCRTLNELREREHKYLSDQQLAEIAGLHLRRVVENAYDPTQAELLLGETELRALALELGYI